jgi:hypothetical protein
MATYDHDKVVKMLKANGELKQSEVATKLGVTVGQVPMLKFCQAQVEAGVYNKAPGTPASIKKLRDVEGNRWELIAARTGKGVAAVKTAYEEAGGDASNSYTGRGRNFSGATTTTRSTTRSGGKTGSGRPSAAKSGGRPSATKTAGKTATKAGGRPSARGAGKGGSVQRNVAGRRGSAGNPS